MRGVSRLVLVMATTILDFDDWYRSEYSRVLAAVLVVCGADRSRAEDATADAFVKALERWSTVGHMDSPTGWVIRVATNNAHRRLSRWRRGRELEETGVEFAEASGADVDVWRALAKLGPRQRAALVLRYADDLTQADVAKSLGVAPGTAAATLHQARKSMKTILTGEGK